MGEIATEQDVLDKYHNAGFTGGTVPHATECVTKGNLTNPSGLPSNASLNVSAGYNDNECVQQSDITIGKSVDYQLYFKDTPQMTIHELKPGNSVTVVSTKDGALCQIQLYYDQSVATLNYHVTSGTQYTITASNINRAIACTVMQLDGSTKTLGLQLKR